MEKALKPKKGIKKNFLYNGLGFPVIIDEVEFSILDGEEYFHIEFDKLKFCFLTMIMVDPEVEFVGGMLKFVRQSLEFSMEEMAVELGVKAKTTILKMEEKHEERIKLTPFQKFKIKSAIKDHLDKIMSTKIERVLKDEPKKPVIKEKPAPMRLSAEMSVSSFFELGTATA